MDYVLFILEYAKNGDILVQKVLACIIQTQTEAVCELFGGNKGNIKVIGICQGEKMYETLLANEEFVHVIDMEFFYWVLAGKRGLNCDKFFNNEDENCNSLIEFNSSNTALLNV